jgi:SAM-dependent methyltransferase
VGWATAGAAAHQEGRPPCPTVTDDDARERRIATLGLDLSALELEPVLRCNLCGCARQVEVARRDRYGFPLRFVVCASCGLGFLSPRPTAAAYEQFYAGIYRPLVSAYHGRRIDAVTVQEEQRHYASELVAFLGLSVPAAPLSVLDVGGSTGVVGAAVAAAFGAAVTVLDPAPEELAVAAAAGIETVAGLAETADLGDRRFDLILLCQTVDHLLDVAGALASTRSWLTPGGYAFVDVLDVGLAIARHRAVEQAIKIDHPYYLNRDTATGYFDRTGLAIVAERLSDDGHWGFVVREDMAREPNWQALQQGADAFLQRLSRLRAATE